MLFERLYTRQIILKPRFRWFSHQDLTSCRYCSREAQKADWEAGHKIECKAWQKMRLTSGYPPDYVPPESLRLLLRTLWRREEELRRKSCGESIPFWQSFDSVASLMDHTDNASDMSFEQRIGVAGLAKKALCVFLPSHIFLCCIFLICFDMTSFACAQFAEYGSALVTACAALYRQEGGQGHSA
jgi:hypothetical protein